jgi:Peptidase C10 family/Spi protease inhibitor
MRKIKSKLLSVFKLLYLYAVGILLLFSCDNSETVLETNFNPNNSLSSINDVSQERAVGVAQVFLEKYNNSIESRRSNQNATQDVKKRFNSIPKTVLEVLTFKTETNDNAFYAINYDVGGFVVVSADSRVSPILAFSEEGKFSNNIDEIPDPVVSWMEEEKESIQYLKESTLTQIAEIKLEWDYLLTVTGNPNLCENLFVQKGPLLQTKWNQGSSFNNLIPFYCPNGSNAPTGCVPTAMAQVMKFHQKPNSYNWGQMPNDYGTLHTQTLMWHLGQSLGMVTPFGNSYSCDGSSANSGNIPGSFVNTFGYSNANYTTIGYSPNYAFYDISLNKPVILTGGRRRAGVQWPWNYYTDGHAWVSDGFLYVILKAPDNIGNCQQYGFRFLHMNWGWGPYGYNGWFNENNFNPSTYTFNYQRGIVHNITP